MFIIISDNSLYNYKFILFALALVLNILTLLYYNNTSEVYTNDLGSADTPVTILSFINSGFAFIVLIIWFLVRFPTTYKINKNYYMSFTQS